MISELILNLYTSPIHVCITKNLIDQVSFIHRAKIDFFPFFLAFESKVHKWLSQFRHFGNRKTKTFYTLFHNRLNKNFICAPRSCTKLSLYVIGLSFYIVDSIRCRLFFRDVEFLRDRYFSRIIQATYKRKRRK